MEAKIEKISELSKLLNVKTRMSDDLFHLFGKFGIGHLLSRLSLEKHDGVSASELILSLCLFRIVGESIHRICKHKIYELSNHGKNCFYRMMIRPQMDCDFNGQIAGATLCYLTYTVMALEKRFTEYQTMGELFSDMEGDLMALTLWKRVLTCIERILRILGETLGLTPQHLMATISGNDKELSKILVMAEALEKWDEVYGQTT